METIDQIEVLISAVVGRKHVTIKDLYNMKEGDVIDLDAKLTDPINLYVNDLLVASGELISNEDGIGIKIKEIVVKAEKK